MYFIFHVYDCFYCMHMYFFFLSLLAVVTSLIEIVQQIIKQEMPPSGYDVINTIAY